MPDHTLTVPQRAALALMRRVQFRGSYRLSHMVGLDDPDVVPSDLEWVECIDGIRLTASSSRDQMFKALHVHRVYQDDVLVALRNLLAPGGVFWDVGANYGFMSLYVGRHFDDQVKIVAFEPSPKVLPYLRRNLAENGIRNASVESICLSNETGTARFYFSDENSWNATLIEEFAVRHGESQAVEVPTKTLDEAVEELPPPTVIKLDVEGAEPLVLEGGRGYLSEHRPPIVAEFNVVGIRDSGHTGESYLDLYGSLGYQAHFMPRPLVGWHHWRQLSPVRSAGELPELCNLVMLPAR